MHRLPEIQRIFARHGLRCTRQRQSLYTALLASRSHPTVDQLHRQVICNDPGISLATVYNTLEAFCRAGLAQKLPATGSNGSARFDAIRDNHLHTRCRSTGTLADVPVELSQQILDHIPKATLSKIEAELGFKVEQVQIELVGTYGASNRPANSYSRQGARRKNCPRP